uniref:Uncharacterized protein n=1 Tax=Triticum urartu TaxID=4572 RepID=A0A8R7PEF7_TRIUA
MDAVNGAFPITPPTSTVSWQLSPPFPSICHLFLPLISSSTSSIWKISFLFHLLMHSRDTRDTRDTNFDLSLTLLHSTSRSPPSRLPPFPAPAFAGTVTSAAAITVGPTGALRSPTPSLFSLFDGQARPGITFCSACIAKNEIPIILKRMKFQE